jgi:hypothetical protein
VYGVFGVTACLYWFFTAKLLDRLSKVNAGQVVLVMGQWDATQTNKDV